MFALQVAKVGVLTAGSMVVGALVQPALKVVGGALSIVGETAETVAKTVNLGNRTAHRAADIAELRGHTRYEIGRMDVAMTQREALIQFGERTEALKERYQGLEDATKEMIGEREARFPKT